MNTKRTINLVAASLLGASVLSACGSGGSSSGAGADECLIGGTPSLTGNSAAYGELFTSGGDLAEQYVNDHPDQFAKVKIDYRDGQALPGPTIQAVQALKAEDATAVMVMGTDALVGAAPVATREKLLVLNIAATTTAQREMGDWVFGNALIADDQIKQIVEALTGDLNVKTVGLIADDSELGDALTSEFDKQASAAGITVPKGAVARITPGGTDFRQELAPLKGKDLDAIMIFGSGAQGGPAVRQAKEIGITADYWVAEQAFWNEATRKGAGDAAIGSLRLGSQIDPDSSEAAKWFLETYEKEYGTAPSEMSSHVFDGVLALATAAKNADSCASDDVRKAMLEITDLQGASGTLDFSSRFAEPTTIWMEEKGDYKVEPVDLASVAKG